MTTENELKQSEIERLEQQLNFLMKLREKLVQNSPDLCQQLIMNTKINDYLNLGIQKMMNLALKTERR